MGGNYWFLLALTIMPGGIIFSRRTAAFVWSTTSFRVTAVQAPWRSSSASSSSTRGIPPIRGGDNQFPSTSTRIWSSSSSSSSARPATISPAADAASGVDQIDRAEEEEEVQASLSIVGSSVQSACFQETIPYLDTRHCQAFRVLFVLGGPGAGT
jgi:hypothetical protein